MIISLFLVKLIPSSIRCYARGALALITQRQDVHLKSDALAALITVIKQDGV